MNYYIYLHIKATNGEPFYIGKGKNYRAYSKHYRNNYWKNIVNKYNYDIILLEENLSELDAFELEKYWIKRIGRKDLSLGTLVNMSDGGDGQSGRRFTDEHKKNMSIANTGKTHTQETKDKISLGNKGKVMSNKTKLALSLSNKMSGKKHSKDTIIKMSISASGKIVSKETKNKISKNVKKHFSVIQYSKNNEIIKIYNSQHDAANELNINVLGIKRCCDNERKTYKNYIWKYN